MLDRTDLRQLAQRITGRYHLRPLSREETKGYVRHRLRVAGATEEIFTPAAWSELHRLSMGIPRVINVACDRALLGAYTQETTQDHRRLVRRAAGEVYGRRFLPAWLGWVVGSSRRRRASPAPRSSAGRFWHHQNSALCISATRLKEVPTTAHAAARTVVPRCPRRRHSLRRRPPPAGVRQRPACKPMKPTPPMRRRFVGCWRCGAPPWRTTGIPAGRRPRPGSPAWINAAPGPRSGP